ncbi:MAG: SUMF1/EgtB/PvdO family nonheme iron enzyme [Bacteroidota bacterium]
MHLIDCPLKTSLFLLKVLVLASFFTGCATYITHPHSGDPGDESPYTGKNWRVPGILYPAYFFDAWPSERSLFYEGAYKLEVGRHPVTDFGVLPLTEGVFLDQTEVTVGGYREFLFHVSRDNGEFAELLPNLPPEVDSLYQSNPPFLFHPVIGISQEQARAYCAWRGKAITEWVKKEVEEGSTRWLENDQIMQVEMRLPTENEWEFAAAGGLDSTRFPFGYSTLLGGLSFEEEDYAYLQHRYWFERSLTSIEAELKGIETSNTKLPVFNVRWPYTPEILQLPVPAYVYSYQPNDLGFYHLIGNVREWVEDTPLSKGGSFMDPLPAISLQGGFDESETASFLVGFRCACEVEYVDR